MKKIPLTQGQYAIVDDQDFDWLMQYKWHANWDTGAHQFRARRSQWINGKIQKLFMHRQLLGFPNIDVDHVNGDPLDNRRSNLRICTPSQNQHNSKLPITNSSGFKGVYWQKQAKKWRAVIKLNHKSYHLGFYSSALEAACAYDGAARVLHGQFAKLNF
jgi:hypothetical protein